MAYYSGGQVVPGLVRENHLDLRKPVGSRSLIVQFKIRLGLTGHEELSYIFRRLGFELTLRAR